MQLGRLLRENFTAEMRSMLSETEILPDCKNQKTEREVSVIQLAES